MWSTRRWCHWETKGSSTTLECRDLGHQPYPPSTLAGIVCVYNSCCCCCLHLCLHNRCILHSDWKGAVDAILAPRPGGIYYVYPHTYIHIFLFFFLRAWGADLCKAVFHEDEGCWGCYRETTQRSSAGESSTQGISRTKGVKRLSRRVKMCKFFNQSFTQCNMIDFYLLFVCPDSIQL